MTSIFISNLVYAVTAPELQTLFGKCGTITAIDVLASKNGRAKGLATITFKDKAGVDAALKLDNTTFSERVINVRLEKTQEERDANKAERRTTEKTTRESLPKKERTVKPRVAREDIKRVDADPTSVYVGNLSWSTTDDSLKALFSTFGTVVSAKVATAETGRSKGYGMVKFSTPASAEKAVVAMDKKEVEGREFRVKADAGARLPSEVAQAGAPRSSNDDELTQVAGRRRKTTTKRTTEDRSEQAPRVPRTKKVAEPKVGFWLYVTNVAWTTTDETLTEAFKPFSVVKAEVVKTSTGRAKGFASIQVATKAAGEKAIAAMNEKEVDGRNLLVRWDQNSQ
jgi:RNA recognition motif-containing protein